MKKEYKMTKTLVILLFIVIGVIVFYLVRPVERVLEVPSDGQIKISDTLDAEILDEMIEEKSYVENQVVAFAGSMQEAELIAEAIGGILLSYDSQVAVIQIGVTVEEMMQMLEEDPSLPKVFPNYQNYTTQ